MKFLFTCGGTAGHINPAISVAGRIRELMPDAEILFVGAKGKMETDLVPHEGYEIETVEITSIRRDISLEMIKQNVKTLKNVLTATSAAKKILREFKPDVAVGTGGYVCYPVLKAAASLGIPTAVHESNAVPGMTTKQLEGSVDRILVGFEESRKYYKNAGKVEVTGTPVRGDFLKIDKVQAKKELGVPADKPLLVSIWGSLGADFINDMLPEFLQRAMHMPYFSMIHASGKRGYAKLCERLEKAKLTELERKDIYIRDYIYDMPCVMSAADMVVCRAGASTLSELTVLGKPALLVPSPNVTNNHQEKNARVLENAGAARVLLERELSVESLLAAISELLDKPKTLETMSKAMMSEGINNATERITDIILDLAK